MARIIYCLRDPDTGDIRYVGKTHCSVRKRYTEHLTEARIGRKANHNLAWVRLLMRNGKTPIVTVLQVGAEDLEQSEIEWIAFLRKAGCRLTNSTDGGEGVPGLEITKSHRSSISKAKQRDFWTLVNKNGPQILPGEGQCWLWCGAVQSTGYGHLGRRPDYILAHRFAYELVIGPIPHGLALVRRCRLKLCVNPHHCKSLTTNEIGRHKNEAKATCPIGHPYDVLHISGGRRCKRCHAAEEARRRERKKQLANSQQASQ